MGLLTCPNLCMAPYRRAHLSAGKPRNILNNYKVLRGLPVGGSPRQLGTLVRSPWQRLQGTHDFRSISEMHKVEALAARGTLVLQRLLQHCHRKRLHLCRSGQVPGVSVVLSGCLEFGTSLYSLSLSFVLALVSCVASLALEATAAIEFF